MLSTPYASRSGRSEGRMGRVFRVALGSGENLAQMCSSFQHDLPLRTRPSSRGQRRAYRMGHPTKGLYRPVEPECGHRPAAC